MSKWETDASVPDLDKLVKLSEAFGVSLDELVHGQTADTAPVPKAAPLPAMPAPAQKKGVGTGQKIAALVLFLCGLMVFFAFLFLGGGLASLLFAAPFWLCAVICAACPHNGGLWCE